MYQAIVFLPLLGAILAGLISLAGARARHPGGPPPPAPRIMPAARAEHAMPRRRRTAITPCDASHAEPEQRCSRPAAGSRFAELITTGLLFISMVLSWIAFVQVGFGHDAARFADRPGSSRAISRSTGRCASIR